MVLTGLHRKPPVGKEASFHCKTVVVVGDPGHGARQTRI